jgi:hypothetical protein
LQHPAAPAAVVARQNDRAIAGSAAVPREVTDAGDVAAENERA